MEKKIKTPDKKMHAGAIIGIVVSILSAVWALAMVIMTFAEVSFIANMSPMSSDWININTTTIKVLSIIKLLVICAASGIVTWLCVNVLKGKATNGLAAGITLLVLSGLGVMSFLVAISGVASVSLLISLTGIAGGVLLIIGKYETSTNKEIVIEPTSETEIK